MVNFSVKFLEFRAQIYVCKIPSSRRICINAGRRRSEKRLFPTNGPQGLFWRFHSLMLKPESGKQVRGVKGRSSISFSCLRRGTATLTV